MSNQEIAKDLTIAVINKMTNPTSDNVSETYHSILQSIGESRQVVTLQDIEKRLTKQDKNIFDGSAATLLSFGGSIVVAGAIIYDTTKDLKWLLAGIVVCVIQLIWVFGYLKKRS